MLLLSVHHSFYVYILSESATFVFYKLDSTLKPALHSYLHPSVYTSLSNLRESDFFSKKVQIKYLEVYQ